ncbi:MAG TPA: hypothetical protein PKJ97_04030, partial [Candidatus Bilamarchaeaceae archaeon]|nr:hypothetical protein [Candidatus Bilamarchaeaceae archaeon]
IPFEQEKEATRAVVRDKITPYQSQEDRRKIAIRKAELEAQYARERSSPTIREIAREAAPERMEAQPMDEPAQERPVPGKIIGIGSERREPEPQAANEPEPAEAAGPEPQPAQEQKPQGRVVTREDLMEELRELKGTMKAKFYAEDYSLIKELPVRDVIKSIDEAQGIYAIVFDGIITQRLVDLAQSKGAKILVGDRLGNVNKKPEKIELATRSK